MTPQVPGEDPPAVPVPVPPAAPDARIPTVPSDSMPPGRAALSVSWASLPLLTLGWGTPFAFAGVALWRRSGRTVWPALLYTGIWALMLNQFEAHDPASGLFGACVLILSVVGGFHAFLIRRSVFDPTGMAGSLAGNEAAVELVRRRRLLRRQARDLARADPPLARELGIGRPGLRGRYDDGGLIDVNHATAGELALLPGITAELAARIEAVREECGGFTSAEELSAVAALPPALTGDLKEFALFLR